MTTKSGLFGALRAPLRRGFLLVPFAILAAWFALSPVRAVVPAPDGGYPNFNTAEGEDALLNLTTGSFNTAIGANALFSLTTGGFNTASGSNALRDNTTGSSNTASGFEALLFNRTGSSNTATGSLALLANTTGGFNTATGFEALQDNTGDFNTATGSFALGGNTTGKRNTAIGINALVNNSTGMRNTALGHGAGKNLFTGNDNIDIANFGIAGDSNTIRIKPMDQASEAILALKPVTFRYKHELDPEGIPQFGLVAEQVEKVNPDLVARDGEGKVNTVRYEAVNAMLLNEFLKQHRKVQELEAAIARQQKDFAQQQKEIKVLAASLKALQLQKVSGRLGMRKPAAQTAAGG